MGSFINITSNNFSGETVQLLFVPCTGGTISSYGQSTLPIDIFSYNDDNESTYGLYQLTLIDSGGRLCEVEYNCPGPGYPFFTGDNNTGYFNPTDMCINAIFDETIYSDKMDISVGDSLYLDSAMTSPYTLGPNSYMGLKLSIGGGSTTYAVKSDNNGVILEMIDCSTLTGGTPTPTPMAATSTPLPATPTPAPTDTPTPTPTGLSYRTIQLSNSQPTQNDACGLSSGLTKYIDVNWTITNGLAIYNDSSLTTKTHTSDPGGYSLVIDNGVKYAVNFDGSGNVDTVLDCDQPATATPTPAPTDTPTPTPGPIFRTITLSNPQSSSENACAQSSGLTKYIDVNFAITNGLVIYNDNTLTSRTYIEDPTGYSLVIDTNGAKYAVTFDGTGAVYSVVDCGNNPTSTPTPIPATSTPTPTVEATTTPTPVPEATTTPTPIPSTSLPAPTSTPTPTPTPAFSAFNISTAGVSELDACGLTSTFTAYSNGSTPPVLGDTVYANNNGTGTYSAGFYKNNYDQVFELDGSGVVIAGPNSCS